MALCTSCGNEVEESASFCTSCGTPMPASVQPSATVTVTRPVCSSCGAQADPDSAFCTECGERLVIQPAPVAKAASLSAAAPAPLAIGPAAMPLPAPSCTSCGAKLEPGTGFCTNCGQPVTATGFAVAPSAPNAVAPAPSALEAVPSSSDKTDVVSPEIPQRQIAPISPESTVVAPAPKAVESTPVEPTRAVVAAESAVERYPVKPAPPVVAPLYARPSDYQTAQPRTGTFRAVVLFLLLLIVVGGFGGWYFMGVETVIVCSPPDVAVFLDGKELAPTSYGRYVIPNLSRQPHLLRVQRAGFADTIERLDFPLTSLHEWVNIKLVPRRKVPASSPR
jgi:predicted amidophosphoribosyltransferase